MSKKPDRIALRVQKGAFIPADATSQSKLKDRGYHTGDVVFGDIRKARNPGFHRLAHQLGQLCADNIEAFEGMDAHKVLKRLQIEAQIGCEEMAIIVPGVGKCLHLIPQSLAFESMDEGQFHEVIRGFCRYIAKQYWPTLDAEQIEEMSQVMVGEAA